MPLRATAVYFDWSINCAVPTKQAICRTRVVQLEQSEVRTPLRFAQRGSEGACRVVASGEPGFWIPDGAKRLH